MPAANVRDHRIICQQPGRYIGWPTIARTPRGELLAVFSGDRDAHVCPFGKTFLVRSADGGDTWGAPELVNDTPFDDRDTGICAAADGSVVVSWFTSHYLPEVYLKRCPPADQPRWREVLGAITPAEIRQWVREDVVDGRYGLGHWVRRSSDGGRTWDPPARAPGTAPHGPIVLSDGRLLFIGSDYRDRAKRDGALVVGASSDGGRTWAELARVSMFPQYPGPAATGYAYLCEPHVVEVGGGRLVGMARYEEIPRAPQRGLLWQFDSADGGHTWTPPRPTAILGKPPHLIRLADGRLLVSYGYRFAPYGQRACLSRDGGVTWDYEHEIVLRDDGPSGDLGYPATVQLPDGSLVTVYYQAARAGEKTCLMATRWQLPA